MSEEFLEQKSLVLAGEWRKNEKGKKAMDFHLHSDVHKAWYRDTVVHNRVYINYIYIYTGRDKTSLYIYVCIHTIKT